MKPTDWISSRGSTRLGISLGAHFLVESCLELCGLWPCCANVRGVWSTVHTNNCIVAATAIPAASAPSFPSVTSIVESLSLAQNH